MPIDDETIMAFADGELDPDRAAEISAEIAADPQLADRVARLRAVRLRVASAFAPIAEEPTPERLATLVKPKAPVIDLGAARAARTVRRWSGREWGAVAAGIAAALLFGRLSAPGANGMLLSDAGGLRAGAALERALTEHLAGSDGPVRLGVSFRSKDGVMCRTFGVSNRRSLSGLACRDRDRWAVRMLAAVAPASGGPYRQAASADPPEVLAAVDRLIDGEPFDSGAEQKAMREGWK